MTSKKHFFNVLTESRRNMDSPRNNSFFGVVQQFFYLIWFVNIKTRTFRKKIKSRNEISSRTETKKSRNGLSLENRECHCRDLDNHGQEKSLWFFLFLNENTTLFVICAIVYTLLRKSLFGFKFSSIQTSCFLKGINRQTIRCSLQRLDRL